MWQITSSAFGQPGELCYHKSLEDIKLPESLEKNLQSRYQSNSTVLKIFGKSLIVLGISLRSLWESQGCATEDNHNNLVSSHHPAPLHLRILVKKKKYIYIYIFCYLLGRKRKMGVQQLWQVDEISRSRKIAWHQTEHCKKTLAKREPSTDKLPFMPTANSQHCLISLPSLL